MPISSVTWMLARTRRGKATSWTWASRRARRPIHRVGRDRAAETTKELKASDEEIDKDVAEAESDTAAGQKLLAGGMTVEEVCRQFEIAESPGTATPGWKTSCRWPICAGTLAPNVRDARSDRARPVGFCR
jgi:hypothetical protein